ncbi:MAG: hypothetical protein JWR19_3662 [Pedosphaera sp.]|nr:hypothetical protein [Pedosphaera sp.]
MANMDDEKVRNAKCGVRNFSEGEFLTGLTGLGVDWGVLAHGQWGKKDDPPPPKLWRDEMAGQARTKGTQGTQGSGLGWVFLSCETVLCARSFTACESGGVLPDWSSDATPLRQARCLPLHRRCFRTGHPGDNSTDHNRAGQGGELKGGQGSLKDGQGQSR